MVGALVTSTLSFSYAAFQPQIKNRFISLPVVGSVSKKATLLTAAVTSAGVIAYTGIIMLANNKTLQAHRTRVFKENASGDAKASAEGSDMLNARDINNRLEEWKATHLVRVAAGVVVWASALICAVSP